MEVVGKISPDQLSRATGCTTQLANIWAEPISKALAEFSINTPARIAAFLAQVAHESGGFRWMKELWGPTEAQKRYERDPNGAWPPTKADQRNRKAFELGNSQPGDGLRYRGRGLVQVTGRSNTTKAGEALGLPLATSPQMLEIPEHAARSAAWFWKTHGLNELADAGDFKTITLRINGGLNGYQERCALWERAKKVFA